jgi:hypothetical protein
LSLILDLIDKLLLKPHMLTFPALLFVTLIPLLTMLMLPSLVTTGD